MGCLLAVNTGLGGFSGPIGGIASLAYTERSATANANGTLNVRSGPGTTYSVVAKLSQGAAVTVIGEASASDGALWYQIRFTGSGGAQTTGYASSAYIQFPASYSSDSDFEAHLNSEGFPESYKPALRQLHQKYPNWVFRAQKTGLDWNDVITNESIVGRNLVQNGSVSSWKSTEPGAYDWDNSSWPGFDSGNWVAASSDIIRYYMDPRNFLDETYIFQFLLQSYNGSTQTREGLENLVSGTFLSGSYTPSSNSGSSGTSSQGPSGSSGGPGVSGPGASGSSPSGGSGVLTPGQTSGPGMASIESNHVGLVAEPYGPGMSGDPTLTGGNGPSGSTDSPAPSGGQTAAPAASNVSYVDAIMNAGQQSGVNPYVLAAMICLLYTSRCV